MGVSAVIHTANVTSEKGISWNCGCVITKVGGNRVAGGGGLKLRTSEIAREIKMNWDQMEGKWKQLKGTVRERWGRLTDDDIEQIAGNREKLIGLLQQRYGLVKEAAEREVEQFMRTHPSEAESRARAAGRL